MSPFAKVMSGWRALVPVEVLFVHIFATGSCLVLVFIAHTR